MLGQQIVNSSIVGLL